MGAPAAQMAVAPGVINVGIAQGETAADESFTVASTGGASTAPLNYFISDNAAWIAASPVQGNSYGEVDTIILSFDTAALSEGIYAANVTVSDAGASNSPQTVVVNLLVGGALVPGDFDLDQDVDIDDYALMQECQTGDIIGPPAPGCEVTDLDHDNDVDSTDATLMIGCMSGSGIPGDPACLD
jgi:hypothetical protein